MSSFRVEVVRIGEVTKHPNADSTSRSVLKIVSEAYLLRKNGTEGH